MLSYFHSRICNFAWPVTALSLLSACAGDQLPSIPQNAPLVIENVTILDGTGGPARDSARVSIQHGRIIEIGPSNAPAPEGAIILDGSGRFLLPGFIDMHAHLLFPRCTPGGGATRFDRPLSERALSRQLDFGVTSVRSPATPTEAGLALRDDLNAGRVRGPRAFASAEFINDSSLSEAGLRQAVRDALPFNPDYFKVYSRLTPEQVATVVDEAHAHDIPVIGHLQVTSWAKGLTLGVDHLVHGVDWSAESLPQRHRAQYAQALATRGAFRARIDWLELFDPNSAAQRRLIADLARRRVSIDVTLMAYDGKFSPPDSGRYRRNPYLASFPELRDDWERCASATANWTEADYRRWQAARPRLLDWIRRMSDGGVLLVTGTDLTNEWIIPGEGLHQEFELLAEAGLNPNEILRMTGANAAEALERGDIGIVAVGRNADLVLLSADPRDDIRNTREIAWVMQGGTIVAHGRPSPQAARSSASPDRHEARR